MTRLLVHVEGQTEEEFVNAVLAEHLYLRGYTAVSARLFGNARQRDRRGGVRAWSAIRQDLLKKMREDSGAVHALMVDYYAMPASGDKAWPGRAQAVRLPVEQRARHVEEALQVDVAGQLPKGRFVPLVMLHEFEALLFSDCAACAHALGKPGLAASMQAIRDAFESPEHINDSPQTAPSKRMEGLVPGYTKPLMGALGALGIGLEVMRAECAHFGAWLVRLERHVGGA